MSFSEATAVNSVEAGHEPGEARWSASIRPGWDIQGNANGGYLLAIGSRAVLAATGRPDIATITGHFLAPGPVGPMEIETSVVKQGKRFGTATAALKLPGGRTMLQVLGAATDLDGTTPIERVESQPPDLPDPDDCTPVEGRDDGFPPPFMNRIDLRLHPEDVFWSEGTSGRLQVRGWFRLREEEPIDSVALVQATDAFPPTAFSGRLPVAWVPTVELTVHVRARPVPGWLRCQFTTRFVTGGFLEEDGEIWDGTGRLVAQSRQLALVPRAD